VWLQGAEDAARLAELQQQVGGLVRQVAALQPLQPKLAAAEVERDTAQHDLGRLQVRCGCLCGGNCKQACARPTPLT
jgi:multidrug resistance efflux pump